VDKWQFLDIINEGLNSKIHALLGYWGSHGESIDET